MSGGAQYTLHGVCVGVGQAKELLGVCCHSPPLWDTECGTHRRWEALLILVLPSTVLSEKMNFLSRVTDDGERCAAF